MQIESKQIVLKDGTPALLRSPRVEDAQSLLDYLKTTSGETDFLIRYPEECVMPLEEEERFIRNILSSPYNVMLLCEVNGRIAGNCSLSVRPAIKVRHRGTVGIALYKEFWGKGIGTAMFEELIRLGKQMNLHQLELEFIEGNERGRALYEKMGFAIVAEHPDATRLKDGRFLKEYLMIKKLD